jgi:hypothetical protein
MNMPIWPFCRERQTSCDNGLLTLNDLHDDIKKNFFRGRAFPDTQQEQENARAQYREMDEKLKITMKTNTIPLLITCTVKFTYRHGCKNIITNICILHRFVAGNVVCFQNLESHTVSNKWYEGLDGDEGNEAEELVKAASRLI